jgi:hypothetical protein
LEPTQWTWLRRLPITFQPLASAPFLSSWLSVPIASGSIGATWIRRSTRAK